MGRGKTIAFKLRQHIFKMYFDGLFPIKISQYLFKLGSKFKKKF